MRPRNKENRDLPPGVYRRKRTRKNGNVWVGFYYEDVDGKERSLGTDLDLARIKWAELVAKEKPADLRIMRSIFDRYVRDVLPSKAPRTQSDNLKELKQLRMVFDEAPIDAITPAMIARYRDARKAKVRANREIATLSHVFNMAREWGLTANQNPCKGVRKNKETPRDYYASDIIWDAVYRKAVPELKDAMDLAYLTGQRPADVLSMRKSDIDGDYLLVKQAKTAHKVRILLRVDGVETSLGRLLKQIAARNEQFSSPYLIISARGKRVGASMLRDRWEAAREAAQQAAIEAGDPEFGTIVRNFQFKDIRPKAATEINDLKEASRLLGHTEEEITKKIYIRRGAVAKPAK
ncbi:tyrosine-type recombinase/integrase [Pseudomonas citronellolis]|uniref:tyrosine-type recombinase/integrase n=1 Tax=Pseudomonas citronellolis TaxID=53408 RepID=UPI0007187110|nr:tyrosine-type recombinase/integrase [Pseudomonas citronellolis]KRV64194.1 integrase [Pseudomonas citronellolis]KRW77490.1 integrase [Pseudomonas citronellolis]